MKIAALARVSGVHRSTIHHYLNVGLLPRPRVAGPKLHWFGAEHLARLQQIRALRERGWPISRVRTHLARAPVKKTDGAVPKAGDALRRRIVEHATVLFAERGYDGVRLNDLARELGIGKASLYRRFSNKQALFIDCVERVPFTLLPEEVREKTERRYTVEHEGVLRARAVLQHFDAYRTIIHLLGSVAHGDHPELAEKARKQFHQMVTEGVPLIRRAIRQRKIRPLHPELLAYILWGAVNGAGEWMSLRGEFTLDRVLDEYVDFVSFGLSGSTPGSIVNDKRT
jgi:AcrR family transcriptional regulator/predicted DNA-binding transcriptional regulator AlpA